MFNIVSILIGIFALGGAVLGFLPFLGWMNWGVLPLALIGAGFGLVSEHKSGRNLNFFVLVVGIARLALGGGIF